MLAMSLPSRAGPALGVATLAVAVMTTAVAAQQALPIGPLVIRAFTLQFDPSGTFILSGEGWPSMAGTSTASGREETRQLHSGPRDCSGAGHYRFTIDGARVSFELIADDCQPRRMILDRSQWLPRGVEPPIEPRRIVRTAGTAKNALPAAARGTGHWPSFRGREASASAEKQNLPDNWNPATGANVLWRTPIPGLAHSSPIVWGDRLFVTSAISSRANATFEPGRYGDGDASDDRSAQRWMLYAIDKRTGKIRWERTAARGEPQPAPHQIHLCEQYACHGRQNRRRLVRIAGDFC
jgi:PQQ-like domain